MPALYEYMLSRPLLVTPEALEIGLALANREPIPESVVAKKAPSLDGTDQTMIREGIAIVPITGPISRYSSMFTQLCGGATVESLATDLQAAVDNPAVKSIVLNIDSPGGEANGISELASMIRQVNGIKPVTAYVGGQGCSAAYWLAAAAGAVVCSDTAMLGSIGTVLAYPKKDASGRRIEFVSSQSPNKRPDPETDSGREEIQRLVDDMTAVFVAAVAEYRGVSESDVVSNFGAGGVLLGANAVAVGMADRVGSFESVVSQIVKDRQPSVRSSDRGNTMNLFNLVFRQKADGQGVEIVPEAITNPAPVAPVTHTEVSSALVAELAEAKAQLQAAREATIQAQAEAWFSQIAKENKSVPAEREAAIAAYVQASRDDFAAPLPNGEKRTTAIAGLYSNRTPHTFGQEMLAEGDMRTTSLVAGSLRTLDSVPPPQSKQDAVPTKDRINKLIEEGLVNSGMLGREVFEKLKTQ